MFCCPHKTSCADPPAHCPKYTFECPARPGCGCCPVGLHCANELCLEYRYKTLAVNPFYDINASKTAEMSNDQASVTLDIMPQVSLQKEVFVGAKDIRISTKVLATPTASRAKVGEVAVPSQANEHWGAKVGRHRLHRLGYVSFGLLVVAVVMLLL